MGRKGKLRGIPRCARRGLVRALAVAGAAALIAGCGEEESEPAQEQGADGGKPTTVNVGVLPIVDVAPLYLGREQGFFEEENLRVKPQFGQGGAALLPAVVSGELQFAYGNTVSLIIARDKGLPAKIVAQGGTGGPSQEEDNSGIVVKKSSPIEEPQDLEGKTIGNNTLENIGTLSAQAALEGEGVDVSKVEFSEVPFPEMIPAVEAGRVDAGFVVEPFVTLAEEQGLRKVIAPFAGTAPELTTAVYFTTEPYIERNPDVVERFVRAMNRSLEYAAENPEEAREILGTYTEIPPEVASELTLPGWTTDLREPTIEQTVELSEKYGYVDEQPALEELIRQPEGEG